MIAPDVNVLLCAFREDSERALALLAATQSPSDADGAAERNEE